MISFTQIFILACSTICYTTIPSMHRNVKSTRPPPQNPTTVHHNGTTSVILPNTLATFVDSGTLKTGVFRTGGSSDIFISNTDKRICLVCGNDVAVLEEYDIRRHHKTNMEKGVPAQLAVYSYYYFIVLNMLRINKLNCTSTFPVPSISLWQFIQL